MEKHNIFPRRSNIFGLIIDNLYHYYFKDRKKQYSSYFLAIFVSTAYAIMNLLILGRNENIVIFESVMIIFVILFAYPAIYCINKLKSTKINHAVPLFHEQTINNDHRHMDKEDSQPLENLRPFFEVSRGGSIILFHVYTTKNTEATIAIVPPIDLNEMASRISGKVGSVENSPILGGIPRGVLSASKNMTASAQLPAQKFLEATYPLSTGIMKPPLSLVAD